MVKFLISLASWRGIRLFYHDICVAPWRQLKQKCELLVFNIGVKRIIIPLREFPWEYLCYWVEDVVQIIISDANFIHFSYSFYALL